MDRSSQSIYRQKHDAQDRNPNNSINERQQMSLSGLLLASEDVPMRELAEDLLRPLREFDERHSGPLVATLRAYLDHRGNAPSMAEALHVHPQTVRYRLRKLRDLFGTALDDPEARFELETAVRIRGA